MITSPTPAQLLHLVRSSLATYVAPTITDPAGAAALAQASLVLSYLEAVVDHELAWIREEIAEIHAASEATIEAGNDADGRIAAALHRSLAGQSGSLELTTARREYQLASEVLSCCVDRGQFADKLAVTALQRRVDREAAIKSASGLSFTSRVNQQGGNQC